MKNFILLAAASVVLYSCGESVSGDKATTQEAQAASTTTAGAATYNVDGATSKLAWAGTGVGHGHNGTFKISNGTLNVDGGKITAGTFDIDVKSMAASDVQGEEAKKLIGHMLSDDFFKAEKFPTAKFVITSVAEAKDSNANATISGNLTLLDSTVNVTFPANVTTSDAGVSAKAKFVIDRTKWGMKYGNDKSLGDKFISPEVGIELDINAKK
ncbi:MAG: hypothetical protein RL660_1178 [Bacteroidota bacterium]|jgi:polyisoprenoid-binding protein YceI